MAELLEAMGLKVLVTVLRINKLEEKHTVLVHKVLRARRIQDILQARGLCHSSAAASPKAPPHLEGRPIWIRSGEDQATLWHHLLKVDAELTLSPPIEVCVPAYVTADACDLVVAAEAEIDEPVPAAEVVDGARDETRVVAASGAVDCWC